VRRAFFWAGVVLGVLLLVGGTAVAVTQYRRTGGPDGVVRGYFAALARADAPRALAFGDVPDGPHTLLTSTVLRAQHDIAPLRDVHVGPVRRTGATATVAVRYTLGYPGNPQTVRSNVRVHQRDGDWRLDAVAVATQLEIDRALQRVTIVGAGIPQGDTLLFPGPVPITFDTPYLQLAAGPDQVGFGTEGTVRVLVDVSPAGRQAAFRAARAALLACLHGIQDVRCPVPDARYVPGSLRGRVVGPLRASDFTVTVEDTGPGVLTASGKVLVQATYRRLGFTNRPVAGRGRVSLPFKVRGFAVPPLTMTWTTP
jgi:hypothetical protein